MPKNHRPAYCSRCIAANEFSDSIKRVSSQIDAILAESYAECWDLEHAWDDWSMVYFSHTIPRLAANRQAAAQIRKIIRPRSSTMPDQRVRNILRATLQLDDRIEQMEADSPLLGAIPELDSMAVIIIVTAIEDEFDFIVDDDEISADTFATLGSLVEFVQNKVAS